jgi:cellulose synthase/poly-beta-1,6-N-acetylglucosamine synthase-like glycosyltransferase
MGGVVSWLLLIVASAASIPTALLCLEIFVGILPRQRSVNSGLCVRPRITVLVPARNEASSICPTLDDIKVQLCVGDRLLVVADNCTDDTATVARGAGAEVVERYDSERVGKGYALDCGLRHLDSDPPGVVVMVDADCRLGANAIDRLASECAATGRPIQSLYLMTALEGSKINQRVAEFAWRVKNLARPLGLAALALPCQLMGAGMAFPWNVIRAADLACDWITEDMKLGLELAAAGHPPLFCPAAVVTSHFASSKRGAEIQRRRWEHGHILTIFKKVPQSLAVGIVRGSVPLLGLALDLIVPPLSLLAMLLTLILTIAGVAMLLGFGCGAFILSAACLGCFVTSLGLAWQRYGRDVVPFASFLLIPEYILAKLGLYQEVLSGKVTANWIGTDRGKF